MDITKIDYSKLEDIEVDGVDMNDYPDFCDAFISSATYEGEELTEEELMELSTDGCFVHDQVMKSIY